MKLYHVVSLSWTFLVVQWNEYTGSVATFFHYFFRSETITTSGLGESILIFYSSV